MLHTFHADLAGENGFVHREDAVGRSGRGTCASSRSHRLLKALPNHAPLWRIDEVAGQEGGEEGREHQHRPGHAHQHCAPDQGPVFELLAEVEAAVHRRFFGLAQQVLYGLHGVCDVLLARQHPALGVLAEQVGDHHNSVVDEDKGHGDCGNMVHLADAGDPAEQAHPGFRPAGARKRLR